MKLKENDNVPEIRFDYFKEEWDKKRFKDFTKLSQGLQIAISSRFLEDGEHRYFYITNEFLNPNSTKKYYIESPSENVICTVDDILMTRTGNTGKVITNISGAFHNNFFKVDYDKYETSKMFLYYLLTSNDIQKEIIIRAGNSTIPDLNHSDFYSIKTSVPALAEQSAIGSFFLVLDNLLASYKDNLVNYQSLKATMLSKMFPKAGQTVPEIRLDGFEGAWECLKIAEIFQIIDGDRGKSYPGESDFYSVGHTLFLDTGNVKKSGLDFSTTKFISEEKDKELRNGKLILGDFILTSRGTLGNVAYYNENIQKRYSSVRINSAMLILRPLLGDKISPDYILAVLRGNLISDFMKVNQVGSAQPHITKKEFSKIKVLVPSNIQEQQAIGSYFSNLDNLINTYQEKISKLETLKKKLLQDMFI